MRFAAALALCFFTLQAQDPDPVITIPGRATSTRTTAVLELTPGQLWRFPQPASAMMMGLNVKAFRESVEGRRAIAIWAGQIPPSFVRALESFDEVYVAVEGGRKKKEPLVLITGRFDDEMVAALLQLKQPAAAGNAVLIGDAVSVAAARRRIRTASAPEGSLVAAAKKLIPRHDLWIAGSADPLSAVPAAPALDGVEGVQGGISFRDTIRAEVNFETSSPEASAQLMAMFQAAMQQASEARSSSEQWEQIARNTRIERHETGVRIRLEIDPKDLPLPAGAPDAIAQLPVIGKPARRSVTIHGMEGGVREIPYSQPQ